jgi:cytochrome P450
MTRIINFCTFDIMAELCFGHPLGFLEKNEYNEWVTSIFTSIRMLPFIAIMGYYPLIKALFDVFQPKSVSEMWAKHTQFSADHVDERVREGSRGRPDIWALVDSAQNTDAKLTREEMHSNGELFMLAGTETSGMW